AQDEALKTLETGIRRRLGIDKAPVRRESTEPLEIIPLKEIESSDFYAVRVKVVKLFEPRHKKMHQVGLLGDESGILRFVSWTGGETPTVEQGKSYEIQDVFASEYEDKISLN